MYASIEFRNGYTRLTTFDEWNINCYAKPKELAEAGFISLRDRDKVQCVFCGLTLVNWNWYDMPVIEHWKHNPECPFIQGYDVGNTAIDDDPIRGQDPLLPCYDVCGNWDFKQKKPMPLPKQTCFQKIKSWFFK